MNKRAATGRIHVRVTLTILYHARLEVVSVQGESLILKRGSAIVVRTAIPASCVPMHVRFPHEMNLKTPASYGRADGEAHRPANYFTSIENSRLAFEVDCDLRDAHCGCMLPRNAELLEESSRRVDHDSTHATTSHCFWFGFWSVRLSRVSRRQEIDARRQPRAIAT